MGIEPTSPAWKAGALPLCYARVASRAAAVRLAATRRKLYQQQPPRQERSLGGHETAEIAEKTPHTGVNSSV